jgi:hypothetical protein
MSPGLYLVGDDGKLIEMSEQRYDSEDVLQTLIKNYPNLLAGDQFPGDEPRRWMLVKREAGIASEEGGGTRWSLDHLFLDQDGVPTLVEVKRSTDTRIRREVVGQMLEYAANATVYWAFEELQRSFEATCEKRGIAPEAEVAALLGGEPEPDLERFWGSVRTNLQARRIRLVFVADEIPSELRRIVEFLNEQMGLTEVIALEVKQYVGEGRTTLAPRVIGQTSAARQAKRAYERGELWTEERFFAALAEQALDDEARVVREIYEWAQTKMSRLRWGRGAIYGLVTPMLDVNDQSYPAFTLWTSGSIQMRIGWLSSLPPFDRPGRRQELVDRVNAIPGLSIRPDAYEPGVRASLLQDAGAREQFFSAMRWFIDVATS